MALEKYSVSGEEVYGEDEELLVRGDPQRSLIRFRSDGGESFVSTRINPELLADARSLPVMHVMPMPAPGEVTRRDNLLTPDGSFRNYVFKERLEETLTERQCRACYVAERHGEGRRDYYFSTEDVGGFHEALAAAAGDMAVEARATTFADSAIDFLPYEFIGELGVKVPPGREQQKVRFGFWGAEETLTRLRRELEARGYQFCSFEAAVRELRMSKVVSIESEPFRAVLREIVVLSRGLGCSFRGEETVEGGDAFLLTRPLPPKYETKPTSFFGRIFGRKA